MHTVPLRSAGLKRALALALPLIAGGCATRYGVTVSVDAPRAADLSCAVRALQGQGFKVTRDSPTAVTVSDKVNVATLVTAARRFEIGETSLHQPMSCEAIHAAAPFLRQMIVAVKRDCGDGNPANVAEVWNQQQCATSFAGAAYPD